MEADFKNSRDSQWQGEDFLLVLSVQSLAVEMSVSFFITSCHNWKWGRKILV